jgi:hypothetical protein
LQIVLRGDGEMPGGNDGDGDGDCDGNNEGDVDPQSAVDGSNHHRGT